jgi:hypothetical protein
MVPPAQVPEEPPLFVAPRTQLFIVVAAQGAGAQPSVVSVHVPKLHA